jgi:hypothetical protein
MISTILKFIYTLYPTIINLVFQFVIIYESDQDDSFIDLFTIYSIIYAPALKPELPNEKQFIIKSMEISIHFNTVHLDPRGSNCNTNWGLHISLLYTKFDYNISFLTLVYCLETLFLFLVMMTLT